jgi:hypothetical protein
VKTCNQCGASVGMNAASCPWCHGLGFRGEGAPPPVPAVASTASKVLVGLVSAIVVLALVVAVGVVRRVSSHGPAQPVAAGPTAAATPSDPSTAPSPDPSTAVALTVQAAALGPGQAMKVASAWFALRDPARFANDDAALASLETGAALTVDQAFTRLIACGCEPAKHLHTMNGVTVVLPPAPVHSFVAQVGVTAIGTGIPGMYTVVFVASGDTWKAALVTLDDRYTQPYVTPDDPARPAPTASVARGQLQDLAAYLQAWRATGSAPRSRRGVWTGIAKATGQFVASQKADSVNKTTDVRARFGTPAVDRTTYRFAMGRDSLVCGLLWDTATDTGASGGSLVQDPAQRNWGTTLAPGMYPALQTVSGYEVCVVDHADGTRELTAYYGAWVQTKAAPAHASV